jgi:hypothetical protein
MSNGPRPGKKEKKVWFLNLLVVGVASLLSEEQKCGRDEFCIFVNEDDQYAAEYLCRQF